MTIFIGQTSDQVRHDLTTRGGRQRPWNQAVTWIEHHMLSKTESCDEQGRPSGVTGPSVDRAWGDLHHLAI